MHPNLGCITVVRGEPQDTLNWLINDMVNNVHAEKS